MNNHEGPGLLELLDITEEASDDLRKTTERITSFTTDFGAKLNAHTENIQAAVAVSQSGLSRNKSKLLINAVADDMNQYVSQVEAELPLFAASMHRSIGTFIDFIRTYLAFGAADDDKKQVKAGLRPIMSLRDSLVHTEQSINKFHTSVASIPPLTSAIKQSKHSLILVLDRLIHQLQVGQSLAGEAENILSDELPE